MGNTPDTSSADAIKAIGKLCELHRPYTFRPPAEPDHAYFVITEDGGYHRFEAERPPRKYTAADLDGFADLVGILVREHEREMAYPPTKVDDETREIDAHTGRPVQTRPIAVDVFIGPEEATALTVPISDVRDRVVLRLHQSEPFAALAEGELLGIGQVDLVRQLATTFRGCLPDGDPFLPLVRRLRWKNRADGASEVRHDGGSYGLDVEMDVAGRDGSAMPEENTFRVPVWDNVPTAVDPIIQQIACSIAVDAKAQRFTVRPYPGEIARALHNAQLQARGLLASVIAEYRLRDAVEIHSSASVI